MILNIIFIILGVAAGLAVGLLIGGRRAAAADSEAKVLAARLADRKESYEMMLKQQQAATRDTVEAMQARFDETVAKMKAEIESLTAEMLKKRQQEFEASSSASVSKILQPLETSIAEMRKAVADNTTKHTELGGQLAENLRAVLNESDAARRSAEKLANVLSGNNKIQGEWGETVLTELLESQGLTEGIHFETQMAIRDESGKLVTTENERTMRPDVVLHLDKDRDVVIDAKVSLSAFLDYKGASTDDDRRKALRAHLRSVEQHVSELAAKDYSKYLGKGRSAVDYVIMFVPNSSALYAATSQSPSLWRKAMERGVYIADEQTLYAALKIISLTWRQISQAENHEKVYGLANEMLQRVNQFMTRFVEIGAKLEGAQKSYDEAMKKLQESGQSIPVTCGKLLKLGAKVQPAKGVPPRLLGLEEP